MVIKEKFERIHYSEQTYNKSLRKKPCLFYFAINKHITLKFCNITGLHAKIPSIADSGTLKQLFH